MHQYLTIENCSGKRLRLYCREKLRAYRLQKQRGKLTYAYVKLKKNSPYEDFEYDYDSDDYEPISKLETRTFGGNSLNNEVFFLDFDKENCYQDAFVGGSETGQIYIKYESVDGYLFLPLSPYYFLFALNLNCTICKEGVHSNEVKCNISVFRNFDDYMNDDGIILIKNNELIMENYSTLWCDWLRIKARPTRTSFWINFILEKIIPPEMYKVFKKYLTRDGKAKHKKPDPAYDTSDSEYDVESDSESEDD